MNYDAIKTWGHVRLEPRRSGYTTRRRLQKPRSTARRMLRSAVKGSSPASAVGNPLVRGGQLRRAARGRQGRRRGNGWPAREGKAGGGDIFFSVREAGGGESTGRNGEKRADCGSGVAESSYGPLAIETVVSRAGVAAGSALGRNRTGGGHTQATRVLRWAEG